MKSYIGIDPGPTQSAFIVIEPGPVPSEIVVLDKGKIDNHDLLVKCREWGQQGEKIEAAIEMIASYGMAVGKETFETVFWIGRFWEAMPAVLKHKVYRQEEKLHLCHTVRAKDANIRQALIDRYGKPGTKNHPGITYGISKDIWAALAVAVTYMETEGIRKIAV